MISFPEYMFLLSILTRPRSGFRVAFDVIDASRENTILRSEFARFVLMASAHKGTMYRSFPVESTLKTHFFGRDGKHRLKFAEFESFIRALQREVIHRCHAS